MFQFGGVYCGATAAIPFTVSNKVSPAVLLFHIIMISIAVSGFGEGATCV